MDILLGGEFTSKLANCSYFLAISTLPEKSQEISLNIPSNSFKL